MKTTYQQLTKVAPCLYRHDNGTYWGRKKFTGEKSAALKNLDTDNRRLADVKLAAWIKSRQGASGGDITFEQLAEKYLEQKKSNKKSTIKNYNWVIGTMRRDFPFFKTSLMKIAPLEYSKFLNGLTVGARSVNVFVDVLGPMFDVAVAGNYVAENPIKVLKNKNIKLRRTAKRKKPTIPTVEEAELIIKNMIDRKGGKHSSKDFLAFYFNAGIGEAELTKLRWENVDFENKKIHFIRKKTEESFYVPFYGWLEPFIIDLHNRRKNPKTGLIFNVQSVKRGIYNTCKRLKLPQYSPRNFRQCCIVRQLRAGIDYKLVALFQGHHDGGKLILSTYSEVISSNDDSYEKMQIQKTFTQKPVIEQ